MKFHQTTLPSGAQLAGYLHEPSPELPGYEARPAVLVLPGGGYEFCSDREADPVALQFAAAGYQAFVLRYTTARTAGAPVLWQPLVDAAGAILHLRQNAGALHILDGKVAVCGFSAGAHLAASTAMLWDAAPVQQALGLPGRACRPDAVVLGYPVVSAGAHAHRGSFANLTGEDPALNQTFSLEQQAKPGLPPFFVWHTVTDEAVPVQNSLLLADALQRNGVPYELHLFAQGGHGMSICNDEVHTPSAHNAHWVALCTEWLTMQLGFHA